MLDRVGRPCVDLEPVEIFLEVGMDQVEQRMNQAICSISPKLFDGFKWHSKNKCFTTSSACTPDTVFDNCCNDLAFSNMTLSVASMEELGHLVELNMPLNNVELPCFSPEYLDTQAQDEMWMLAWSKLLCSITSIAPQAPLLSGRVRLIVPIEYLQTSLVHTIVSALIVSCGINGHRRGIDDEGYPWPPVTVALDDPIFWYWLGCLLVQIKTMSISGIYISPSTVDVLEIATQSQAPLQHLVKVLLPNVDLDKVSRQGYLEPVRIDEGTVLDLHHLHKSKQLVTASYLHGRLLRYGLDGSPLSGSVFHGRQVQSTEIESAQRYACRVDTEKLASCIKIFSCSNHRTICPTRALLLVCPNLKSLGVSGAIITSLDSVWDAYARGCKFSSIEFAVDDLMFRSTLSQRLYIDDSVIEFLLTELKSQETAISRTLKRLSLVHQYLHWNLVPLMDDMLAANSMLTHFWFLGCRSDGIERRWIYERHHGELLPPMPLHVHRRLAFLSVRHQLSIHQRLQ